MRYMNGAVRDPALWFANPDEAQEALTDWTEAHNQLNAQRDAIITGALAAGVTTADIHRITGIARTTINRIPPRPTAVPEYDGLPLLEYKRLLKARAAGYHAQLAEAETSLNEARAYARYCVTRRALAGLDNNNRLTPIDRHDARAHALVVYLRRIAARDITHWARDNHIFDGLAAAEGHARKQSRDTADAYWQATTQEADRIATELTNLRAHGYAAYRDLKPEDCAADGDP